MQFNVEKCQLLHIGTDTNQFTYSMLGKPLMSVEQERDLGVTVSKDLKSYKHCVQAYNKVSCVLAMLKCTIHTRDRKILTDLYKNIGPASPRILLAMLVTALFQG